MIANFGVRAASGLVALAFAVLVLFAAPASAQVKFGSETGDPAFLSFGAGVFDVIAGDDTSAAFHVEYASDTHFWVFHPVGGLMLNSEMGGNVYGGIGVDLFFTPRIVVTPSFAPSLYWRGSSKNLGYPIEFRSAIAAAYRFDDRSRLGVEFYHLSNAGLGSHNPGTEVLLLKYSLPFGKAF